MLGDIKMWTSCFEASSCQDESATESTSGQALKESSACADEKHWPEGHSWERDSQLHSLLPLSTPIAPLRDKGPEALQNSPFPLYVRKRDSRVEGVCQMFGLHRSTVHLTCWICRGHQLIMKIILLYFALLMCSVVCRREK